jgi:6-phosphogluconolactonase (cycloisomerase 2 family)
MPESTVQPAVYVQTNDQHANEVIAFRRAEDGALARLGSYATGGTGDGHPHLPSQGSLVVTHDGRHLLVCNAGSASISLLAIAAGGLTLVASTPSGGGAPKSLAEHDGLVYVLNTSGPSLAGFRIGSSDLEPLPGGAHTLMPSSSDPAQVGFSPDGRTLVVTQRGANALATFPVAADGTLGTPRMIPSAGPTPYGFAFAPSGTLVVTEAFGAAAGRAAASSYSAERGQLAVRSPSVGNGRSEICWAAVTPDGRFAFATNFADGAVSRYALAADGTLSLDDPAAGLARDGQTGLRDEDLTADGAFLYAVDADARRVLGWRVEQDGGLAPVGSWDGLPATVAGLAAS